MLIDILDSDIKFSDKFLNENYFKASFKDFEFFHIQEITFEEEAPTKEALENVLGSLRMEGVNFVYLIVGEREKISFYFGVVKNRRNLEIDIDDIANQILKSNIEGNFRGSKIRRIKKEEKLSLQEQIKNFTYIAEVNGVPNVNEEAKKFQGIDRLVDVMLKDEFALMIISSALSLNEIKSIEKELFKIYDKITPFVKKTIQKTISKGNNKSETTSISESNSESENYSKTNSESDSTTKSKTTSKQKSTTQGGSSSSTSESGGESNSEQNSTSSSASTSQTTSKSTQTSKATSTSQLTSENENETINVEFAKKELEEWLKYIDEVLLKRINYAKGKGAFLSGVYLLANTKGKIKKLGNSFISLFSGVEENKLPLEYELIKSNKHKNFIYNFQLPKFDLSLNENQKQKMILYSKIDAIEWFSTKELSVIASLPQKEIVGLRLKEEVEFGLNIPKNNGLNLGKLVRNGQTLDIDVNLNKDDLNKHIFITGVTGSGKTTTCHKILYSSNMPFLVIEPAKTEYRVLAQEDDILVFTLGNENIAPFRLNPFEFLEGENISSRVDMIKAAIESSFDMEAAIPQIIETAIYRSYEDYGWDIGLNENLKIQNPFEKNKNSFPLLEDVILNVEKVVEEQNFDERLKKDYIASIKARLQSLMIGTKRYMLNSERSFNFKELLDKKVIIELEDIKNPNEKAFIMGLILINLNEALKSKHKEDPNFKHITLIEEAHRLLSRYEIGDSLNKKSAIESFTDMLAEVRKYGESLIIVDQIPNKLTPEVLKNTNTKIVHRIFAQDDKEAIGNTMALENEQKEFLSKLEVGRAIVFNQSFYNAIQVQITPLKNISTTTSTIDEKVLREKFLRFYFDFSDFKVENLDTIFQIENLWNIFTQEASKRDDKVYKIYYQKLHNILKDCKNIKEIAKFLAEKFHSKELISKLEEILIEISKGENLGINKKYIRR